jgi:MoCo/4Fe-4S cofactor protein with predicted Tat translocation signal
MTDQLKKLDLEGLRARITKSGGREYWQTLEELSKERGFDDYLAQEFPQGAEHFKTTVDRRNFVKLMGASVALAGLTACDRPSEAIVPYVQQPENLIPGRPLFFSTAMTLQGGAQGLLVESHMGRPTKIEGNPDHPGSSGATDIFAQAQTLQLYDPDRSQTVRFVGDIATWSDFQAALTTALEAQKATGGAGLRILTEHVVSPTLGAQMAQIGTIFPSAGWHQYEPAGRDNVREGTRLAFGSYANVVHRFSEADVVVSLGADFTSCGGGAVRYSRELSEKRKVRSGRMMSNRLYVLESAPSTTGAIADHRYPVRESDLGAVASAIAAGIGAAGGSSVTLTGELQALVAAMIQDLGAHRGRSIVIAGDEQPAAVHALVHAINGALGNIGRTVLLTDSLEVRPVNGLQSIRQLVADIGAGRVEVLLILGGNPVFNAPSDLQFAKALDKVGFRAHLSSHYDETSERCQWHVPETHFLEMWSDTRAYDGTASIVQPLIAPLYNGRSAHEVLATVAADARTPYEIVRETWRPRASGDFETFWRRALHDGFIAGTAAAPRGAAAAAAAPLASRTAGGGIEGVFRYDPTIYDGRFANNGWLQETPKPMLKTVWDNVVLLSPATAARLGVENESLVEISNRGDKVTMPVWISPGHADDSATIHYGYGRTRVGSVGNGAGFNAYLIRTSDTFDIAPSIGIRKVGGTYDVASTQGHHSLEGRDILRSGTIAELATNPTLVPHGEHDHKVWGGPTLYPAYRYDGNAWGMAIDTSVCTGCSACVVACVAENNLPVIGKDQVRRQREMHWLRIDRYYSGDPANPAILHQPMLCQHCENAPCEPVCPVEATTHSEEGLNEMTYNRCVGTRYCSNNCPYKVRRFNFLEYNDWKTPSLKMMRNPDVTVRSRGVMEKCTYCVQRIKAVTIETRKENRPVRDGEIVTACQQACPTGAIVFGNINDKSSQVAKLKAEQHNFGVLSELNTQPRTSYLATIRNPHPELAAAHAAAAHGESTESH